jgi:predicted Ser/Thr protein kinase
VIIIKRHGGYNLSELELVGKGTQGSVYKIDSKRCIKVFKKKDGCKKEIETLLMAQGNKHFPKILESGENFIVREYIDGIELDKYIIDHSLDINITKKILQVYDALGRVGYRRQDIVLFHILVTKKGVFRIIDTGKVMKEKRTYPKLILEGLEELGYKNKFLELVKLLRPDLYASWI